MTILIKGIDISKWQATTPSLGGLDFIGIRATYATSFDTMYLTHYRHSRTEGLVVFAYHFGVPASQASINLQAAAFIKAAGDADGLFLDLEKNGSSPSMSLAEAREFIARVKATDPLKRKVLLYHSLSGFPNVGQDANWKAAWGTTQPAGTAFWQYRGSPLDLNYYIGSRAQLNAFVARPKPPVPAPVPAPIPVPVPVPQPVPVPVPVPVPAPEPVPQPDPVPVPDPAPEPTPDPVQVPVPDPVPAQGPQANPVFFDFLQAILTIVRRLLNR